MRNLTVYTHTHMHAHRATELLNYTMRSTISPKASSKRAK